jgi:formylglycine-generating enzyme required for sulfatase activity
MDESERPGTNVVKTLMPNELGLYNMSGNVSEWCSDWYDEDYYANSPSNNPQGPDVGEFRVVRGGGWFDLEGGCCVFSRGMQESSKRNSNTGLRLVISID